MLSKIFKWLNRAEAATIISQNDPREEASARSMRALSTLPNNLDSLHQSVGSLEEFLKQGNTIICFAFLKDHSSNSSWEELGDSRNGNRDTKLCDFKLKKKQNLCSMMFLHFKILSGY